MEVVIRPTSRLNKTLQNGYSPDQSVAIYEMAIHPTRNQIDQLNSGHKRALKVPD